MASASADSFLPPQSNSFFVYILRCADDSYYVGHTGDLPARMKVHNDGRGAVWTACRRPVTLVYQEPHRTEQGAITRERQIKRWTHAKKRALIAGDLSGLKVLSQRLP